ncbi:hypothetical protein BCV69DRAFT_267389 [Microstroma glucosiphilum]|uniref:Translation elongation factor EFTs/EF1B dimerisation domain-containing protein n=1 Tax=Pseudomicrostroma glucosiphilum TaxID=1684307 RepID=A0A316UAI9_9BASI|nr:hypothetical protein BCV69DRAFT_267389 [Pseudomicrostroma glucosiphilum]PWN22182.1 hypothetical protein BCV69DRAFT_267389 [Pseudomicrostroma glucosiphilum]
MSFTRLPLRSLTRAVASSSSSSSTASALPTLLRSFHASPCSSADAKKVSMSGISAIRKAVPGTSMIKAKEALLATFNAAGQEDLSAALTWLEDDRQKSGAKKAEKVALREAKEGMVGICILADGLGATGASSSSSSSSSSMPTPPPRAGLVELNCETDFVARNEVFNQLVQDLSHTAALFPDLAQGVSSSTATEGSSTPKLIDLPLQEFLSFPVLTSSPDAAKSSTRPRTVQDAIVDMVSRLGEKITLARASSISTSLPPLSSDPRRSQSIDETYVVSSFAHGGAGTPVTQGAAAFSTSAGKVASLLLTRYRGLTGNAASPAPSSEEMTKTIRALGRSLARQAAGMETTSIRAPAGAEGLEEAPGAPSTALYSQPFLMLLPSAGVAVEGEEKVEGVLQKWCRDKGVDEVEVVDIRRWALGETATIAESSSPAE